ncbi:MAG: chemotaxis protein CheW [Deltaproteobacteria bacterium]|nr:chemotaxis protein CheW [Deltaproteobacteria bacterium]
MEVKTIGVPDKDSIKTLQLVTFRLGQEEYSLDILRVQEIIRYIDLTRVPRAPEFVEGVINLRGRVIPVLDLRNRFGLPDAGKNEDTRIIVVDIDDKTIGLKVDAVSEVLRLSSDTVEPPPSLVMDGSSEYIMGVGKVDQRLIILLDVSKLLNFTERHALSGKTLQAENSLQAVAV